MLVPQWHNQQNLIYGKLDSTTQFLQQRTAKKKEESDEKIHTTNAMYGPCLDLRDTHTDRKTTKDIWALTRYAILS